MKATREVMAAKVHNIWCSWMKSVFDRSVKQSDGSVIIPKGLAERWQRQIATSYDKLSNQEKISDQAVADDIINTFNSIC